MDTLVPYTTPVRSGVLNWHYYEDSDDTEISGDRTIRYHATFQTKQSYSGGKPNYNPKLIADGTMTIQNFQNGYNLGGIISATTLNITTNKSGATFRNDNLAIIQQDRSEEHTSELQSLMRISYAVFCLKKKKQNTNDQKTNTHQNA